MALYESVWIARQDISTTQVEALTEQFSEIIKNNGGEVKSNEQWGLRSLAYKIKKNRKGHYVMFNIEAPASAVAEMERNMRLNASRSCCSSAVSVATARIAVSAATVRIAVLVAIAVTGVRAATVRIAVRAASPVPSRMRAEAKETPHEHASWWWWWSPAVYAPSQVLSVFRPECAGDRL